jgi:DNA-binding NarL/FixJ family response regulator
MATLSSAQRGPDRHPDLTSLSGFPDTLGHGWLPGSHAMPSTVLVVDDDVMFRGLATRILTAMGFHVVGEAGTYAAAVAAAAELRPSAVLVDVELPDGDGVALAEQLVALPWRPRVVVASSDPEATSSEAVQRFGAVGFMAKEDLPDAPLAAMLAGT